MQPDPWTVLGVRRGADPRELRRAFRRRARELHPDRRPNDAGAEERFKRLVDAFLAATEDARRHQGKGRGEGEDGIRIESSHRTRGRDVIADFTVDLAEALRGGAYRARLRFDVPCRCRTAGRPPPRRCPACAGRGVRRLQRRVAFRIPPGTRDGDMVRVAGAGFGHGASPPGDLHIRIRVLLPAGVWVEGNDLHAKLPLTILEAIAGARITVPVPPRPIVVAVPPGTGATTVLRVRRHGLPPRARTDAFPGDLFLHATILVPPSPSQRHLRAAATLSSAHPRDPRAGWFLSPLSHRPSRRCT